MKLKELFKKSKSPKMHEDNDTSQVVYELLSDLVEKIGLEKLFAEEQEEKGCQEVEDNEKEVEESKRKQ